MKCFSPGTRKRLLRPEIERAVRISGILALFLFSCKIKQPVETEEFLPVLAGLSVPQTVYLKTDTEYPVSVRVTDPQGLEDVTLVWYSIRFANEAYHFRTDTLMDDGKDGDILPEDGIYFGLLGTGDMQGRTGVFHIEVNASDRSGNIADPVSAEIEVKDSEKPDPPFLFDPLVPDTLRGEELKTAAFSVRVADPQGPDDIDSVYIDIYLPLSPVPFLHERLHEDAGTGQSAAYDLLSEQGFYRAVLDLKGALKIGGLHSVRFQGMDRGGLRSKALVLHFFVEQTNDPPVLSHVEAPDMVSRSAAVPFTITVQADDPQGPEDISQVYFNTTKPDGSPSSGNPFSMFDDGTSGDEEAGDGIYSLTIAITSQNDKGVYLFTFFARDRAGATSDPLVFEITVED